MPMPTSPRTPRHKRQSSSMDTSYHGKYQPDEMVMNSPGSSPMLSRRSQASFQDNGSVRNSLNADEMSMLSTGAQDNGLGNLADELADALVGSGEDEDDDYEMGDQPPDISFELPDVVNGREGVEGIRDSGVDVTSNQSDRGRLPTRTKMESLNPPAQIVRGHRRKGSEYDGSEYGSESDLDSPGMTPKLVANLDAIESLARRGIQTTGSPSADGVFKRLTDGLRELGSQSGVEGSTTRLITAHSALATHVAHQTRQLHNLAFPLLSPLVAPPDPDAVDELLPVLMSLSDHMPRPATSAHNSLTALHSVTTDLVQTLSYLSDTLHMSRQTTATATRRLKSAKDMVADLNRENELKEEAQRWLTRGNWGERLQNRECASVCREVVSGFEEVCNGWRSRLLAQAESA